MKNPSHRSGPLLIVLFLAAFGPYVIAGSLRTDHLFIYPFFLFTLASIAIGTPSVLRLRPAGDIKLLLILVFLLVGGVTLLFRTYQDFRQLLGAVENYLQPIAVIIIVGTLIAGHNDADLRRLSIRLIKLYTALLMINAVIAAGSLSLTLLGREELVSILLGPFWGTAGIDQLSTAEKSLGAFRFSGIFDQPYEAGLHHSFGLLLIIFMIRLEERTPITSDYLRLLVVAAGGLLSFSKVIIFGGIPFLIFYLLWEKWLGKLFRNKLLAAIIIVSVIVGGSAFAWFFNRFSELWTSTGLIPTLISTRLLRADSVVLVVAKEVMESSPLLGLGFGAFTTYDNAYLEYWAQGGVFAVALYVVILGVLGWAGVREYGAPQARFYILVSLFVILAGVGAPVLTANRFTVVFWTLMTIFFTSDALRRQSKV